jgi:hypothetical protein
VKSSSAGISSMQIGMTGAMNGHRALAHGGW